MTCRTRQWHDMYVQVLEEFTYPQAPRFEETNSAAQQGKTQCILIWFWKVLLCHTYGSFVHLCNRSGLEP
jgi:hypothetical protein